MSKLPLIAVFLTGALCFTTLMNAQPSSSVKFDFMDGTTKSVSVNMDEGDDLTNRIFFTDTENQLLFIDFEALGEDISELSIKLEDNVVFKDNVANLPKNTIYELNLKELQANTSYKLVLATPFGLLTKVFFVEKI